MVFNIFLAMMLMYLAIELDAFWLVYFMPIPLMLAYKEEMDIKYPTSTIRFEETDDKNEDDFDEDN